jgi:hypothetical protein
MIALCLAFGSVSLATSAAFFLLRTGRHFCGWQGNEGKGINAKWFDSFLCLYSLVILQSDKLDIGRNNELT